MPRHSGFARKFIIVKRRSNYVTRAGLVACASATALAADPTSAELSKPTPTAPASTLKITGSAAVKETFDSNVFLQSETDKANRSSLVTSVLPSLGLNWKPASLFDLTLNYSPEAHIFHSEGSEDFFLHRTTMNLTGKQDATAYDLSGSVVKIDGSSVGPTWTGPGGAPATGAPTVRDRRDATVYRTTARVTQNICEWFVRPAATVYVHDFQMEHRSTAGYQNFADRNEFTFGVDVGHQFARRTFAAVAGYRYGIQDQDAFLGNPVNYDSRFHRMLFGVEGKPRPWLKANIALGPEFREFAGTVAPGFGGLQRWNFYVDASLAATVSKADTLTFSAKRFEQPGSSGRATYQDGTYDLTFRHKLDDRWTIGAGGRGYNTEFRRPAHRNDWVLSGSAFVNCAVDKHLSVESSYVFESGLTLNANSSGREYERHLVALGLKYTFQ